MNKINALAFSDADRQELSQQLGVVCHFVSDFFCRCHCSQNDNVLSHFIYESALHFSLKKLLKTRTPLVSQAPVVDPNSSINSAIPEVHKKYLCGHTAIEKDISFAINCSLMVCEWVIDTYCTKYATEAGNAQTLTA